MRPWFILIVLASITLSLAVSACDDDDDDGEDEATPTATVEEEIAAETEELPDEPEPTDAAEPTTESAGLSVDFEVVSREDLSFGTTVRVEYRVIVSDPLTDSELRRIAQVLIDDETSQQDVNAIGFFFFLPGTDTSGFFTAGKADWAPNGDWSEADTVEAGDYSTHELGDVTLSGATD